MINMSIYMTGILSVFLMLIAVGIVAYNYNGKDVKSIPEQNAIISIENASLSIVGGDGADGAERS